MGSITNHQKQTKPLLENEDENKKEKRKRRTKAEIEEDKLETEKQVDLAKEKQASLLKSVEGVDATELQKERKSLLMELFIETGRAKIPNVIKHLRHILKVDENEANKKRRGNGKYIIKKLKN